MTFYSVILFRSVNFKITSGCHMLTHMQRKIGLCLLYKFYLSDVAPSLVVCSIMFHLNVSGVSPKRSEENVRGAQDWLNISIFSQVTLKKSLLLHYIKRHRRRNFVLHVIITQNTLSNNHNDDSVTTLKNGFKRYINRSDSYRKSGV